MAGSAKVPPIRGLKVVSLRWSPPDEACSPNDKSQSGYNIIKGESGRLVCLIGELPDHGMDDADKATKYTS